MTENHQATIAELRSLDVEPEGPARIDLAAAITEGRRRRRAHRTRLAGGAALALLAVAVVVPAAVREATPDRPDTTAADGTATPSPGASATAGAAMNIPDTVTQCTPELLPVPGGVKMSLVTGGDPTGRFILGRSYPAGSPGSYPVLVWDNGRPREVSMLGDDQSLKAINTSGVAVGSSYVKGAQVPWVYRDGRVTRLKGVTGGSATAINEAGRIVGTRDEGASRPVFWPSPEQPARDLALPGVGWWGEATGVDDEGNVVGVLNDSTRGSEVGYLWPADGGAARQLPMPVVAGSRATSLRPVSIRSGWITALAYQGTSSGKAPAYPVRYKLATGEYVPLGGDRGAMIAWAANGRGWMAGTASPSTPTPRDSLENEAVLLTDLGAVPLPDLAGQSGRVFTDVRSLSDDGRVIGGQLEDLRGADSKPQAVMWRCR